jgi:hypothetical protein
MQYVPPKRLLMFTVLQRFISQKIDTLTVTAVKTLNPESENNILARDGVCRNRGKAPYVFNFLN